MTGHATEVSAEAEQTGKHAADVCKDAAGLNTAVGELRHAVIRVVRTSTTEMDRRHERRFPEDLNCRVTIAGHSSPAHVADLSEHGAYVRNGPSVSVGARGTLAMDSVGFALPFSVRAVEDGVLHLAFELDEATAARFRAIPEQLGDTASSLTKPDCSSPLLSNPCSNGIGYSLDSANLSVAVQSRSAAQTGSPPPVEPDPVGVDPEPLDVDPDPKPVGTCAVKAGVCPGLRRR